MKLRIGLSLFVAGVLFLTFRTDAQNTTGTITGRLMDTTGAVVTGAKVTVQNLGTGEKRVLTSGDSGDFTATLLLPGRYSVTAQRSGFKTAVQSGINLDVDQTVRADVTMLASAPSSAFSTICLSAEDNSSARILPALGMPSSAAASSTASAHSRADSRSASRAATTSMSTRLTPSAPISSVIRIPPASTKIFCSGSTLPHLPSLPPATSGMRRATSSAVRASPTSISPCSETSRLSA
jgi:hypothetical protein